MELVRTNGFTAKDLFNIASATPLKNVDGQELEVTDVCIRPNKDGEAVGYLKDKDGVCYATISTTCIEQIETLAELVPATVKVVSKKSNGGRTYFVLELV